VNDLDSLTASLKENPTDPVTIQALAEWLEERGGNPVQLRALMIDAPTMLVLSYPADRDPASRVAYKRNLEDLGARIAQFFFEHTGHPVEFAVVPSDVGIRQIRVSLEIEKAILGKSPPSPIEQDG
jgi:hypothetical protein